MWISGIFFFTGDAAFTNKKNLYTAYWLLFDRNLIFLALLGTHIQGEPWVMRQSLAAKRYIIHCKPMHVTDVHDFKLFSNWPLENLAYWSSVFWNWKLHSIHFWILREKSRSLTSKFPIFKYGQFWDLTFSLTNQYSRKTYLLERIDSSKSVYVS